MWPSSGRAVAKISSGIDHSRKGVTMSIKVYRVLVPKDRLAAMPKEERAVLLLLGHAENELNTLIKLILMSRNGTSSADVIRYAEASQTFVLAGC